MVHVQLNDDKTEISDGIVWQEKSNSVESADESYKRWGNRGWFEIIDNILTESWNGSMKTHIMNKCNLNSRQVENYLHFLLERRLLMRHQKSSASRRTIYKTTELGRKYVEIFRRMEDFFSIPPLGS